MAVAQSRRARVLGLALMERPSDDRALLIPGCRSVHTFGMRFALDIAFLDREGALLRLDRAVPPGRVRYCREAAGVLETGAGAGERFAAALTRSARLGARAEA